MTFIKNNDSIYKTTRQLHQQLADEILHSLQCVGEYTRNLCLS